MHLYDFPQSPNCRRVRMYLAEKGIALSLKPLDLLSGEQKTAAFLGKNPFGAVPLLELDDGSVIAESLAIIEYLEELHPDPPLFGTTPFERAQARVWERRAEFGVLLQGTRRFLHTSPYFAERIEQSPKVAAEAGQVLSERLSLFNTHLQDNEWLAGAYSVADITLFVAVEFAAASNFQLDPAWEHVQRWCSAIRQRPSAQA